MAGVDSSDVSDSSPNTARGEAEAQSHQISGYLIVSGPNDANWQNTLGPKISSCTLHEREIDDCDIEHPIKKLHQRYADLKFKITKLRNQIDSQRETIDNISEKYAKKKQEAAFYEEDAKIEKIHVHALATEVSTLKETVQSLLTDKGKLRDEIDSYHANEEHTSQVAGLKHDVDNDNELHELTSAIEKLENDLHKKEDDNQKLIHEVSEVKSEMSQMKSEFHEQMFDMRGTVNDQMTTMDRKLDQLLVHQNEASNKDSGEHSNESTQVKWNGRKNSHTKKPKH